MRVSLRRNKAEVGAVDVERPRRRGPQQMRLRAQRLLVFCVVAGASVVGAVTAPTASASGGQLDPGFGTNGIIISSALNEGAYNQPQVAPISIAIQPDHKILVLALDALGGSFELARFNATGALDRNFGSGGVAYVATNTQQFAHGYSVAVQPDNKIVFVGETDCTVVNINGSCRDANGCTFVARLLPSGVPDSSFGNDGLTKTCLNGHFVDGQVLMPETNGDLFVGGVAGPGGSIDAEQFAAIRYTPDGKLDMSFGRRGTMLYGYYGRGSSPFARSVAPLPNGDILLGGSVTPGNHAIAKLLDITPGGRLASGFGTRGTAQVTFPGQSIPDGQLYALHVTPSAILAAGESNGNLCLFKWSLNGRLARRHGAQSVSFPGAVQDVVFRSSSSVVAVGRTGVWGNPNRYTKIEMARYGTYGRLDHRFGRNGIKRVAVAVGTSEATAAALEAGDQKLVVAGDAGSGRRLRLALLRLLGP